jgi:hypothetical protein
LAVPYPGLARTLKDHACPALHSRDLVLLTLLFPREDGRHMLFESAVVVGFMMTFNVPS